jgi:hypothetical protein
VESIRPGYTVDVSCQGSVPEAIIAFLDSDSVESAIRLAISQGGDADTQACISGALAEAAFEGVAAARTASSGSSGSSSQSRIVGRRRCANLHAYVPELSLTISGPRLGHAAVRSAEPIVLPFQFCTWQRWSAKKTCDDGSGFPATLCVMLYVRRTGIRLVAYVSTGREHRLSIDSGDDETDASFGKAKSKFTITVRPRKHFRHARDIVAELRARCDQLHVRRGRECGLVDE